MKQPATYQPIILALLATLILAGLFYLPYLWVRNRTIDDFAAQQTLLARQAADGLQTYFADYGRALDYLGRQPGVQQLDSGGRALLEDFLAIHPDDIAGVQRQAADGRVLFAAPGGSAVADDNGFCEGLGSASAPAVSDVVHATAAEDRIFFAAPVRLTAVSTAVWPSPCPLPGWPAAISAPSRSWPTATSSWSTAPATSCTRPTRAWPATISTICPVRSRM